MRKVIAIASADWHLHRFRNFDIDGSRLDWGIKAAREIMNASIKLGVPLLFAGDLLHTPKEIETETNAKLQNLFRDNDTHIAWIAGNHDMSEKNSLTHRSPNHLDAIQGKITTLDLELHLGLHMPGIAIWGIPYMNSDLDLRKSIDKLRPYAKAHSTSIKILLLHSDAPGAKTPEGFTINETEHIPRNLDKFFKEWDLVLFGHIHKPQQLSKRCYMLGSPIHQTAGDTGIEMGYWRVYSDKTMKFIPLKNYPKFIRLKEGEIKPKDTIDYYIDPEVVLVDEEVNMGEFNITNSKSKLARSYIALKNIKSKTRKRALIKVLNETE